MDNKVLLVAVLDGISRRKDGSMTLRFVTNELDKDHRSSLDDLFQAFGILYFREGERVADKLLSSLDELDIDIYDKKKSQSVRIRNIIWKNQEKELDRKPTEEEFKEYYRVYTEKIITHLKNKLD